MGVVAVAGGVAVVAEDTPCVAGVAGVGVTSLPATNTL